MLIYKIDGFLKRSYRYGFTKEIFHIQTIIDSVTYDLFNSFDAVICLLEFARSSVFAAVASHCLDAA